MKRFIALAVAVLAAGAVVFAGEAKKDEVELKGKLGCGHCSFNKGEGCNVAFKTDDGKIYILQDPDKSLMKARMKGGEVKVTGTVTEKDGELYVKASKVEKVE